MQMSAAGVPSQSVADSVSWTRYSERCERRRISGAESANCLRTVQVPSSKHTPTTESGSLVEKLSRDELLSASRMDIGFISHSEQPPDWYPYLNPCPRGQFAASSCRKRGLLGI